MRDTLTRRGLRLEYATLGWNVVGVPILIAAAIRSGSPAVTGFGLDSAIEIGASLVVVWELTGAPKEREAFGVRLIGFAFLAVAVCITVQAVVTLVSGDHPGHSVLGIVFGRALLAQ